ncbi:hypothetical protein F5B21DRAFT_126078 [Xylaria acuta]|nr:hypothetical protein F5B21DRAFT_126078 [Xylaria acuta]
MTASGVAFTCAIPPFLSLVRRSIEAWESLTQVTKTLAKSTLESYTKLDDLLCDGLVMFWFFQRREAFLSQKAMTKWSGDRLDEYVLLPALNGYVSRRECFFVSHFWHAKDDPDPDGTYLRLNQEQLRPQSWRYIWVDWTCIPQDPRRQQEEVYFLRSLDTMSGIIRNCGFQWFYPPFEARLWILYEIAEYSLTCDGELQRTPDIEVFRAHIGEMLSFGVRSTLDKHGYTCTYDRDKEFLTSWLELLVLLTRLHVDIGDVRRILDGLTWHHPPIMMWGTIKGVIQLHPYEGTLEFSGERYTFTPLPEFHKIYADATSKPAQNVATQQSSRAIGQA